MIALRPELKVVVAAQPVDFRKSLHTLSALVSEALRANPYCGDVFVFRSKRMDRVKLLAWDWQRHGADDEVAAPGTLHLAAPAASFNPPNHKSRPKAKIRQTRILPKAQPTLQFRRSLFFTYD